MAHPFTLVMARRAVVGTRGRGIRQQRWGHLVVATNIPSDYRTPRRAAPPGPRSSSGRPQAVGQIPDNPVTRGPLSDETCRYFAGDFWSRLARFGIRLAEARRVFFTRRNGQTGVFRDLSRRQSKYLREPGSLWCALARWGQRGAPIALAASERENRGISSGSTPWNFPHCCNVCKPSFSRCRA